MAFLKLLRHPPRWPSFAVLALLGLFVAREAAPAQSFDATDLRQPADLDSPWLVHGGDDAAYARPDFDDSQWVRFDSHNDIKRVFAPGHPDVVWYRMRVKVSPSETGLALREQSISRAVEIYVNGERLITAGQVAPFVASTWNAPILQKIPIPDLASGSLLIALRVHISKIEWASDNPGFTPGNLTIGQYDTLYRADWLTIIGAHALSWTDELLMIALGFVALVLFAAQRRQTEYLWIAAVGMLTLAEFPEPLLATFYNFPLRWEILSDLLRMATPCLWVGLYFSFIQQRIGWRWGAFLAISGFLNAFMAIQGNFFILPLYVQLLGSLPFIVLLSVFVPAVLGVHWRRGNREAGILLIPSLLFSLYIYAKVGLDVLYQLPARRDFAVSGLNLIDRYPAGPFSISLDTLSSILSTLALAIILLLRSTTMSRRQAIIESELAAAKEVQKVLLPEHREIIPGFIVDSVYEPAQQVGGDFFQILPAANGGLVIVVGDVAGKGLPAAMLVSVLVGAIYGLGEYTEDPAELLTGLNERLVGRSGGGFSTALAAHISANGKVIIANAGHLSPYLDGKEIELPGALPLGVAPGVRYEITQFRIDPGSRLTFYSDGVVEAQNQQGELFGFDRAKAISTEPAAAIAEAAKEFGQEDDITVVTITRSAAIATAA